MLLKMVRRRSELEGTRMMSAESVQKISEEREGERTLYWTREARQTWGKLSLSD
jgi:hypothetical protein